MISYISYISLSNLKVSDPFCSTVCFFRVFKFHWRSIPIRGDQIRFSSVFIKKTNQTEIFFKKTETGSNWPVLVWFGFLGKNQFKPVWFGFFSSLARFFRFSSVFFGSVFSVLGLENRYRTEPVGFFKILFGLIGFFSWFGFIRVFFLGFSVFLLTPNSNHFSPVKYQLNAIVSKWLNAAQ